jgi:adenosylcobinamide-phosphate synthase
LNRALPSKLNQPLFCAPAATPLLLGYAADCVLGDPKRRHPVSGFGALARWLERLLYRPRRSRGALCSLLALAIALALCEGTRRACPGRRFESLHFAAALWCALGGRSLLREARAIGDALQRSDLQGARLRLPALVGRDVEELGEHEIARAVVESLAENSADAVIGALWWGALLGAFGVVLFRGANTLDAIFGHRNARYREFGFFAARLDDALVYLPARLGALAVAICAPLVGGSPRAVIASTRKYGRCHSSPNAGVMEAAFAGALGLRLGGALSYEGIAELRPAIGEGARPQRADIERAARLAHATATLAAVGAAVMRRALAALGPCARRAGGVGR